MSVDRLMDGGSTPVSAPSVEQQARNSAEQRPDAEPLVSSDPRFGHEFSRIPLQATSRLQARLAISRPDDDTEREADHVAAFVMRMPVTRTTGVSASSASVSLQRKCQACEEEEQLQRKESGAGPVVTPPIVGEVLHSPGEPLDAETRAFMEPRFGHDFSRGRVHSGTVADQSARELSANAYTVGHNIVFAGNRFAPTTDEGRRLLAHELTHVVQQSKGAAVGVMRSTTRGAGGCGPATVVDEDEDGPKAAGRAAHRQIQAFLLPTIRSEEKIPRGTKRQETSTGCQPESTIAGRADLLRMSGLLVEIGEIKPFPWASTYGVTEVEHYIRRSEQSIDRRFGFGVLCPGMPAGADDVQFARTVHAGKMVPRSLGKLTGILTGDTVIGPFDGDTTRTLKAKLAAPGAVGYWCTGGASDTYTCGVSQEETRAYIDRVLTPAQEVLSRVMEETIERPLARALEGLTVRQLLELGERHMGPLFREALRPLLGPLADQIINHISARELGDFIDQNLGPVARSIATTLARRFASRVVNELRVRLRNVLADMVRDTLVRLCVGVPVVTLVQLLSELEEQIRLRARQLMPAVATAVALAMVAEVAELIRKAIADVANAVLRVLALIALVLLAVAIIVVGIILLIALVDPIPGDEVAIGAAEAFLIQLLRSLAGFVFAAAESSVPPAAALAESDAGQPAAAEETKGTVA